MKMTIKILSYIYESETYEKAYIDGCKDICKIIKNPKLSFNVEKLESERENKRIKFNIFLSVDSKDSIGEFCKVCKEYHCSFFINEEYNCSRCNLKSFVKRMNQRMNISKGFYRKKIEEEI